MPALKTFLPFLSRELGMTHDMLYSRVRVLRDYDLLPQIPGLGPNKGTQLSAETLGVFIIALMFSEYQSEWDDRVIALCKAKEGTEDGDMRSRGTVCDALADLITECSVTGINPLKELRIYRYWKVEFDLVRESKASTCSFYVSRNATRAALPSLIRTMATLDGKDFEHIVRNYKKTMEFSTIGRSKTSLTGAA